MPQLPQFRPSLTLLAVPLLALLATMACAAQEPVLPGPPAPPPPPACVTPSGPLAAAAVTLGVNPSVRHQTLAGFGTTVRLFDDPHLTETFDPATQRGAVIIPAAEQNRILAALYSELGLTRVRYATDPGVEPVNDNSDPTFTDLSRFDFRWKRVDGHVDYVVAARPFGVTTWFGAPIFPEPWMSKTDPGEYVEWAFVQIQRWRALGQTLPYWSIFNEPTGLQGTGTVSAAFVRDAVKLLGARLAAASISTRLVIPDDVDPARSLAISQAVLADPVARQYVGAIAFHLYESGTAEPNLRSLEALSGLARQYAIPLWMTEWYTPDWFVWARTMHAMLANYDAAAVDYLWGFFGQWDGRSAELITINTTGNGYTGFVKSQQYWTMGQWSRVVPAGAITLDAVSSDPGVQATAWLVADHLVVVALNVGSSAKSVQVALGAGSPCVRTMTAERTSGFETARVLDPVTLTGPGFTTTLPAGSVTTFVVRP